MADIYKFVKKSNNSRPLYTSYELSKNVKDKRIGEGISEAEFASKYGITMELLQRIEEGNSSFSPKLYRVCGKILGLSTEELLSEINDDMRMTVMFRGRLIWLICCLMKLSCKKKSE